MLAAKALTKDHGTHRALDAVSFTVGAGEIFCLLGANGAGKSTTLKLFLGFLQPTSVPPRWMDSIRGRSRRRCGAGCSTFPRRLRSTTS